MVQLKVRVDDYLEEESDVATFRLEGWVPGMKIEANPNLTIEIAVDELPRQNGPTDTLSNGIESMIVAVEQIASDLANA